MISVNIRLASRLEALQITIHCLLSNLDSVTVCKAQTFLMSTAYVKPNQMLHLLLQVRHICVCDNRSRQPFVEGLDVPGLYCGQTARRCQLRWLPAAAAAPTRHNTRCSRAPSVIFCNVTVVAWRPPHAPKIPLHRWKLRHHVGVLQ